MRSFRGTWMGFILALVMGTAKVPAQFTYIAIATAAPSEGLGMFPAINSDGTVAFIYSPHLGRVLVLAATEDAPTTIADLQGPLFSISSVSAPSINEKTAVAFTAVTSDTGQAILVGQGGPLTRIADTNGLFQTFFGIPALNGDGTVAFGAMRRDSREGLYAVSDGTLTTLAETDDDFSSFHNNGGPTINGAGTVAFNADRGRGRGLAIFTRSDDGVVATMAETSDTFIINEGRPAINADGMVAFLAFFRDGQQSRQGIFTVRAAGDRPSLMVTGGFSGTAALNGAGTVAYNAILAGGAQALYTKAGPDEDAIEVIRTGEPLFESTATLLGLSTYGLNDKGQIAFAARLADGRTVIVRADPAPPTQTRTVAPTQRVDP